MRTLQEAMCTVMFSLGIVSGSQVAVPQATTRPCTADVENIGARLAGNRFYTQWRVQHDAGNERLATVFFKYTINYTNKRGTKLVEDGVFRELVRGQGKQYTEGNISLHDPVDIISVDFDSISCTD